MHIQKPVLVGGAPGRTLALALIALLAGGAVAPSVSADHGFPHVEVVAMGTFADDVSAMFTTKGPGNGTTVIKLKNASDMVVLQIDIEPGGVGPWHTHTGTGMLINQGPGILTNAVGDDCDPYDYMPGDAFIDPGDGELHAVRNDSADAVRVLAVFFGVDGPPVSPGEAPDECGFLD